MPRNIGCQKTHARLLHKRELPVTLETLLETSGVESDFYSDIIQCDEVYNPFSFDYSEPIPHHMRHRLYFYMHSDTMSLTTWQVAHGNTWESTQTPWHRSYLYHVSAKIEDIHELVIYELMEMEPGQPTYISFSDIEKPTISVYRRVHFHRDIIAAPPYNYRDEHTEELEREIAPEDSIDNELEEEE